MMKYLRLYSHLFTYSLKALLAYRFSLIFKVIHGPAYIGCLLCILLIAYNQTSVLGGWTREQALLLFAVFNMINSTCLILFFDSIRDLLWNGIRQGKVDSWLLKPGSVQFYLNFSQPQVDMLVLWLAVFIFFIYELLNLRSTSWIQWLGFFIVFFLGHCIVYLALSIYATFGFYMTRSGQVIELFDKASDFSQYPISIFPHSLQFIFVTFIPIAFYSYIPTLFLLNQGSWWLVLWSASFTLFLIVLNQLAWKHALRHYSSASS